MSIYADVSDGTRDVCAICGRSWDEVLLSEIGALDNPDRLIWLCDDCYDKELAARSELG